MSNLHLSSINNTEVTEVLCSWESVIEKEAGRELIRGEADTFQIHTEQSTLDLDKLKDSLPGADKSKGSEIGGADHEFATKSIIAHESILPSVKETPHFDHKLYYSSLKGFQLLEKDAEDWGKLLMYGEVVTSTNTLLEKYDMGPNLVDSIY